MVAVWTLDRIGRLDHGGSQHQPDSNPFVSMALDCLFGGSCLPLVCESIVFSTATADCNGDRGEVPGLKATIANSR
jgi:hypothetical protein